MFQTGVSQFWLKLLVYCKAGFGGWAVECLYGLMDGWLVVKVFKGSA
jgi:hypothetical protein